MNDYLFIRIDTEVLYSNITIEEYERIIEALIFHQTYSHKDNEVLLHKLEKLL